jgi:hypothetical protein
MKKILALMIALVTVGVVFNSCQTSGRSGPNPDRGSGSFTYSTTSNIGDYAEWTFDGTTASANWQIINSTGGVNLTYLIVADCDTFNSAYGYYTCTITSAACTPGLSACGTNPSGTFDLMEVPETAIFVHTGTGTSSQLHVGLIKDSNACTADVSGDYVYARTGLGNRELFGAYRTDGNFVSVTHADFAMSAAASATTPVVEYTTQDSSGTGQVTFTDGGCTSGVRKRTLNSDTLRAMLTNSGLFILDMPAGQGGIVSFKTTNAASLSDFANKTFGGISFPDDAAAAPILAVTGDVASSAVPITSGDANGSPLGAVDIRPATNNSSAATSPAFPDMTVAPASGTYSLNTTLQPEFPSPATLPGLFRIDGALADTGRVLLMAAKLNGKVVAFGFVYNWRDNSQVNPATGFPFTPTGLYNTGNFILFER